jgi:hypothetical protein
VAEFGKEEDFMICGMGDERTSFECNRTFVRDVVGTSAQLKSESKSLQKDGREKWYSNWILFYIHSYVSK